MQEELIQILNTMNVKYTVSKNGRLFTFKSRLGGKISVLPKNMTTTYNGVRIKVDKRIRKARLKKIVNEHISSKYYDECFR